ncbi:unnamed protein product [Lymnaea stagnalis]|uniref:Uncharacterized protein n=1 Tax=Lymnaea stagnalis TaxID=6523 RepID=A0AAV2HPY8_LYMST
MEAPVLAILGIVLGILISLPNVSSLPGDSRRGGKCQHITRYLESPDNTERRRHQSIDPEEASVFHSLQDGEERRRFLNFVKDSPVCTHSHEENEGRRTTTPSGDATARIIIDLSREYCARLKNSGARNIPVYCTQTNG